MQATAAHRSGASTDEAAGALTLVGIALLAACRARGLGTRLIRALLREAGPPGEVPGPAA